MTNDQWVGRVFGATLCSADCFERAMSEEAKVKEINVERNPSEDKLSELGARDWPIWTKEASEFPWSYDATETCYVLEGRVVVTPDGGEPVEIQAGDLVTFPVGMSCTWKVVEPIRKHYNFG